MNWIDWAVLAVIALSAAVGLIRGFVKEAVSTIMLVAAFWVAGQFYPQMATHITGVKDEMLRNGLAMFILFIITLLVGAAISHLIGKIVNTVGLTGTNMVLGVIFGALRGILIVAVIVHGLSLFSLTKTIDWNSSQLIPYVNDVISWFTGYFEAELQRLT